MTRFEKWNIPLGSISDTVSSACRNAGVFPIIVAHASTFTFDTSFRLKSF